MDYKQIFKTIDDLNAEYLEFLTDIVKIESPTTHKQGVDAVCKYITDKATQKGWQVEFFEHPIVGNASCITLNPNTKGKPVCISGHMDTVHAVGSLLQNPIRYEDDKLSGPGLNDCKGGIVAGFMAMDALERCGFSERPIKLILQSDEENGSRYSKQATINFMIEKAKDCVCFLNAEPYPNGITVERKGIVCYDFVITGVPCHSAKCKDGRSAIAEACHKILELEKLKDEGSVTCNCGTINGGVDYNIVPDKCTFGVDFRFKTKKDLDFIFKKAEEVANTTFIEGTSCELIKIGVRKSLALSDNNLALFDKINDIYLSCGFEKEQKIFSVGGSDSADISSAGITCLDGFGPKGANIHKNNEFLYYETLSVSAKKMAIIACFIKD